MPAGWLQNYFSTIQTQIHFKAKSNNESNLDRKLQYSNKKRVCYLLYRRNCSTIIMKQCDYFSKRFKFRLATSPTCPSPTRPVKPLRWTGS